MDRTDLPDPAAALTADLDGALPRVDARGAGARGAGEGEDSLSDLSAPPDSEDGSLAALLNVVAAAPSAPPPIELAPGDEVGGHRIVRKLGAGGMGVVYLARDPELQREVALKVHRAASGTERLYREAVAMAQLAHPNVVTIHGVGRVQGQLYLAMEYVPGDNLSRWMEAAPRSWREILDLMLAVGDGLVAAHDAGFVHRDIKPHNILVGLDGRPRLGDFGLVRVAGDATRLGSGEYDVDAVEARERVGEAAVSDRGEAAKSERDEAAKSDRPDDGPPPTKAERPEQRAAAAMADTALQPAGASGPTPPPRSPIGSSPNRPAVGATPSRASASASALSRELTAFGTTLGTPAYMAPEQLAGRPVDARADQFAYCVVLYEALYGQRPWRGGSVRELRDEIAKSEAREPVRRGVPAWVWTALRRGLAREPGDRHADVRALLVALRTPSRRARRLAIAGASVAAIAMAALLVARSRASHGPTTCDAAGTPAVEAWGPSARNKIAANYVRVDPQAGPDATKKLAEQLDGWSQRWQRAAVQSCQARGSTGWTSAVRSASQQCLRSSLAELRALVSRASRAPVLVDGSGLPDPDRCADPGRLAGNSAAPAAEIEGYWNGDFGHMLLRRVGDELWGAYEHDDGTVRGKLVGDRFVGWWCEAPSRRAPGDAGDVEMQVIVDRDGARAIAGRWRYGATGDWDDRWDMRADPAPPSPALLARFDVAADFCGAPGSPSSAGGYTSP